MMRHKTKRIQSKLHRIGIYDICKISLSCFDGKRYILDDGLKQLIQPPTRVTCSTSTVIDHILQVPLQEFPKKV